LLEVVGHVRLHLWSCCSTAATPSWARELLLDLLVRVAHLLRERPQAGHRLARLLVEPFALLLHVLAELVDGLGETAVVVSQLLCGVLELLLRGAQRLARLAQLGVERLDAGQR
jgi:hypothetical protein